MNEFKSKLSTMWLIWRSEDYLVITRRRTVGVVSNDLLSVFLDRIRDFVIETQKHVHVDEINKK